MLGLLNPQVKEVMLTIVGILIIIILIFGGATIFSSNQTTNNITKVSCAVAVFLLVAGIIIMIL